MQLNFGMFAEQYWKMSPIMCIEWPGGCVADHEFLENVVLDGSGEFLRRNTLLFGGDDIKGHDGKDGAVHGHGNGHLVQRNLVKQDFHILDTIDGHAGLADITSDALVIGVIAAVRGQIEGYAKALLPGGKIAAIEGVGIFGGREAGVLANRPGLHGVHGGVRPAQEWRKSGGIIKVLDGGEIGRGV